MDMSVQPAHSESYLFRVNNPNGYFKPESEHIAHVKQRMKERFDLDITTEDYYEILRDAQVNHTRVYKINHDNSIWSLTYRGVNLWLLYGAKGRNVGFLELPARIKTVLRPFDQYVVPARLSHLYDHISFTAKINESIEKMREVSVLLDLNDKKSFFMRDDIHQNIKVGALRIVMDGPQITTTLVSIALGHIVKIHNLHQYHDNEESV